MRQQSLHRKKRGISLSLSKKQQKEPPLIADLTQSIRRPLPHYHANIGIAQPIEQPHFQHRGRIHTMKSRPIVIGTIQPSPMKGIPSPQSFNMDSFMKQSVYKDSPCLSKIELNQVTNNILSVPKAQLFRTQSPINQIQSLVNSKEKSIPKENNSNYKATSFQINSLMSSFKNPKQIENGHYSSVTNKQAKIQLPLREHNFMTQTFKINKVQSQNIEVPKRQISSNMTDMSTMSFSKTQNSRQDQRMKKRKKRLQEAQEKLNQVIKLCKKTQI